MSPPRRREPPVRSETAHHGRGLPVTALLLVVLASGIIALAVVADRKAARSSLGSPIVAIGTPFPTRPKGGPTPDYRTPFRPFNQGDGSCHDPQFTLEQTMPTDHVYHAGETLSVNVRYNAPGCATLMVGFGVRHVPGSPRYAFYCHASATPRSYLDPCEHGFGGNIPSNTVMLQSPSGVATLTAQPGTFPPAELASVPDLEGAQLCAVIVQVSDGVVDGSRSHQQIDIACPEDWY